jgi:hypothetical protein
MVSRELVRAAILWHELWHEGLEEASRLYFTENNHEAMIATLEPLHELVGQVIWHHGVNLDRPDWAFTRRHRLSVKSHLSRYSVANCKKQERPLSNS